MLGKAISRTHTVSLLRMVREYQQLYLYIYRDIARRARCSVLQYIETLNHSGEQFRRNFRCCTTYDWLAWSNFGIFYVQWIMVPWELVHYLLKHVS